MTLLNKVMTNTIHYSVHPVSTQSRHKWYGILIVLLYLAVQLDLHTVTNSTSLLEIEDNNSI